MATLGAVVDQHPLFRASGVTRMLAVLALLAGIVAMHAGVFSMSPAHAAASHSTHHATPDHTMDTAPVQPDATPGCGGADCDLGHAGLHGCVFILTAFGLTLLLVLLYYVPAGPSSGLRPPSRHWRAERERPPPWTVLSLAELSILRI
ncbi:DUF6153 family protein [Nocardia sp. NPDC127579]|uniref:DUF6153 family protein n=1 Tax=Nocardia sp. NPDC127579 TaxID=3345402 RepID=UPI003639211E